MGSSPQSPARMKHISRRTPSRRRTPSPRSSRTKPPTPRQPSCHRQRQSGTAGVLTPTFPTAGDLFVPSNAPPDCLAGAGWAALLVVRGCPRVAADNPRIAAGSLSQSQRQRRRGRGAGAGVFNVASFSYERFVVNTLGGQTRKTRKKDELD